MLFAGNNKIAHLFVGDMGIKRVCIGAEIVYERPGSYIYVELDTSGETSMIQFAPLGATAMLDSAGKNFLVKKES